MKPRSREAIDKVQKMFYRALEKFHSKVIQGGARGARMNIFQYG